MKRRNKRRNIGFETKTGQGKPLPGFLVLLALCFERVPDDLTGPADALLISWAYMRSVTAVSLWPSRSLTDTTSAPLVIARLAEVWRSLCG